MISEEKIFYIPGTLVTLKHDEMSSPVMLVIDKKTRTYTRNGEIVTEFVGIKTQ